MPPECTPELALKAIRQAIGRDLEAHNRSQASQPIKIKEQGKGVLLYNEHQPETLHYWVEISSFGPDRIQLRWPTTSERKNPTLFEPFLDEHGNCHLKVVPGESGHLKYDLSEFSKFVRELFSANG